jgi:NAD(P)-dependent dehydrogenase (short-subunit alcohol dehydrogenase family)
MLSSYIEYFGKLDILADSSRIKKHPPFRKASESEYDAIIDVNLRAFFVSQAFVQHYNYHKALSQSEPVKLLTLA